MGKLLRALVAVSAVVAMGASHAGPVWTLFGTEIDSDRLFTVNLSTGAAATVGTFTGTQIEGIAFDPSRGAFWGVNNSDHTLLDISLSPPSWSISQALPNGTYTNIARNPVTGTYYTNLNLSTNSLATLDPLTGNVSAVGVGQVAGVHVESLAFDTSGRLFGIGYSATAIDFVVMHEFDTVTGNVLSSVDITSSLANPRFDGSLAINPATGIFYTVAAIDGGLYELDPTTGIASRVGSTGMRNVRSLDFALIDVPEPPSPNPAPEPASLALVSAALAGLLAVRRRRSTRR